MRVRRDDYHTVFSLTLMNYRSLGRDVGVGGASTYMSVDVERISEGLEYIHEFWASVVNP